MQQLPVACSLTPRALEARRSGLLADLIGPAASREELLHGHRTGHARVPVEVFDA